MVAARMGTQSYFLLIASQLITALKAGDIPAIVVLLLIQVASTLRTPLKPEHSQFHYRARVSAGAAGCRRSQRCYLTPACCTASTVLVSECFCP
jgi:hypothetical protein